MCGIAVGWQDRLEPPTLDFDSPIMFLTRSEYGKVFIPLAFYLLITFADRGVNTFSPEGRLFQGGDQNLGEKRVVLTKVIPLSGICH